MFTFPNSFGIYKSYRPIENPHEMSTVCNCTLLTQYIYIYIYITVAYFVTCIFWYKKELSCVTSFVLGTGTDSTDPLEEEGDSLLSVIKELIVNSQEKRVTIT